MSEKFDFLKWTGQVIQHPKVLEKFFEDNKIVGKVIKKIKFIGPDNLWHLAPEFLQASVNNNVEIDEPIIIVFEDGDKLEIEYTECSTVKLSVNLLKDGLSSYTGDKPLDADVTFSDIYGKTITSIEVRRRSDADDFTGSFGLTIDEHNDEYIGQLIFHLSDGYIIEFTSFYDWAEFAKVKLEEGRIYKHTIVRTTISNSRRRFGNYKKGDIVKTYFKILGNFRSYKCVKDRANADGFMVGSFMRIEDNNMFLANVAVYEK